MQNSINGSLNALIYLPNSADPDQTATEQGLTFLLPEDNLTFSSGNTVLWITLITPQVIFNLYANSLDPDQTATYGAV